MLDIAQLCLQTELSKIRRQAPWGRKTYAELRQSMVAERRVLATLLGVMSYREPISLFLGHLWHPLSPVRKQGTSSAELRSCGKPHARTLGLLLDSLV